MALGNVLQLFSQRLANDEHLSIFQPRTGPGQHAPTLKIPHNLYFYRMMSVSVKKCRLIFIWVSIQINVPSIIHAILGKFATLLNKSDTAVTFLSSSEFYRQKYCSQLSCTLL